MSRNEPAVQLWLDERGRIEQPLFILGSQSLFPHRSVGLFCSARCPGTLVLQAYDLARALRDARLPVIGGFHSSMEKECLDLLLRGSQPVIVCLGRSLERMRLPLTWQQAIEAGRLLVVSEFTEHARRVTAANARQRNQLIADLASALLVIHAAPDSQTLWLSERAMTVGKPVFVLDSPHNEGLRAIGGQLISPSDISQVAAALAS